MKETWLIFCKVTKRQKQQYHHEYSRSPDAIKISAKHAYCHNGSIHYPAWIKQYFTYMTMRAQNRMSNNSCIYCSHHQQINDSWFCTWLHKWQNYKAEGHRSVSITNLCLSLTRALPDGTDCRRVCSINREQSRKKGQENWPLSCWERRTKARKPLSL